MRVRVGARAIVAVLVCAGCSRDVVLPEAPRPGVVTGRVLAAVPGKPARQPAAGASIVLVGTALNTTSGSDGRFSLDGVLSVEGQLLFRFDVPGAVPSTTRQKLVDLSRYKVRPDQSVDLGDVVVVENAQAHGQVLRGDARTSLGGHSGSVIFVPQGPLTAYSSDDGTWSLSELPEGPVQLAFFHTGYAPQTIDAFEVRGGEDVTLRTVFLEPLQGDERGALSGTLAFVPDAPVGDAAVRARGLDGTSFEGAVAADASFHFATLPPGLYDLSVTRSSYTPLVVQNVLVLPKLDSSAGRIVLTQQPAFDAGTRPSAPDAAVADAGGPPDASIPDAGPTDAAVADAGVFDAGFDAGAVDAGAFDAGLFDAGVFDAGAADAGGSFDAGAPDAGAATCVSTMNCSSGQWCDRGLCRAQCASTNDCDNGRVCEPTTRTCVTPCDGGCGSGSSCEIATNLCHQVCDVSVPCPTGQRCGPQYTCIPECLSTGDCANPFVTCQAGACVPTGGCAVDTQCPATKLCVGGTCTNRVTARLDGGTDGGLGAFSCAAACDCRMDERCEQGACVAEAVPTVFVASDGTGDGGAPFTPTFDLVGVVSRARRGDVIALRSGDTFTVDAGLVFTADSGVSLVGGYSVCGPNRWARDVAATTAIDSTTEGVVALRGTSSKPLSDFALRNLTLANRASLCTWALVDATWAPGLHVEHVKGNFVALSPCGSGGSGVVVAATYALNVVADGVELTSLTGSPNVVSGVVYLSNSSGAIRHSRFQPSASYWVNAIAADAPIGPITISDNDLDPGSSSRETISIRVLTGGAVPVVIERNHLRWPRQPDAVGDANAAIYVTSASNLTVQDNFIDGAATPGTFGAKSIALKFDAISGSIRNNHLVFPTQVGSATEDLNGIAVTGSLGPIDLSDNLLTGGLIAGFGSALKGLSLDSLASGPVTVQRNVFMLGTSWRNSAVTVNNVPGTSGLRFLDNRFTAGTANACNTFSLGLYLTNSRALVERSSFVTGSAANTYGVWLQTNSTIEAYSSFIYAGVSPNNCLGAFAHGLELENAQGVWVRGSTIDTAGSAGHSAGVTCGTVGSLSMQSNIIGGGTQPGSSYYCINGGAPCSTQSNWQSNYFFISKLGAPFNAGDPSQTFGSTNTIGNSVSCYDPVAPTPTYLIAAGSPCVDHGAAVNRIDSTPVVLDIDGRVRDGGTGPDIGAWEHP